MTRREFFGLSLAGMMGATVAPAIFTAGCSGSSSPSGAPAGGGGASVQRPNILLVMMDEFRLPPVGYAANEGEPEGMKEILGFASTISPGNPFVPFLQGFLRLRQNAVVMRTHYTASAACVPSRTTIMTGQYPTVHGVTQTTGLFKSGDDPGFVFLDPNGIPTVGDWFQAAGYETYYFGKWHVSEACDDLGPWGFPFASWDGPEPHGANPANMGVYRDPEFAKDAVNFLKTKGAQKDTDPTPWFAVASFVNPHDASNWPIPWFEPGTNGVQTAPFPLAVPTIPAQGALSNPAAGGQPTDDCPAPASIPVALNPDGFPENCFNPPPTLHEDLSTKPTCQFEMSYKVGLGLKSQLPAPTEQFSPHPFQLQGADEDPWTQAYGQIWSYLHYLSDLQMRKVLQALDDEGLAENTIVIFTADHGDYTGAHNHMIQKWHTAYEEAIRVPLVVSSPLVNPGSEVLEVVQPTSSIDLLPTLLGLAGFNAGDVQAIKNRITGQGQVPDLVGTDLSGYILDPAQTAPIPGHDGQPRPGVLFMTDDEITQMTTVDPNNSGFPAYVRFLANVDLVKDTIVPPLTSGPVVQPNLIRTLANSEWKYSRYYDPNGVEADQYEMYHLESDPNEMTNLVNFMTNQIRPDVNVPGFTLAQLTAQKDLLAAQLAEQEALLL